MPSLLEVEDFSASNSREDSLYVVSPQFSIALDWKSGIAARSWEGSKKHLISLNLHMAQTHQLSEWMDAGIKEKLSDPHRILGSGLKNLSQ